MVIILYGGSRIPRVGIGPRVMRAGQSVSPFADKAILQHRLARVITVGTLKYLRATCKLERAAVAVQVVMNSRWLMAASILSLLLASASCEARSPLGPTSVTTLDQLVGTLRQQGLRVVIGDELPTVSNPFFSAPGRVVFANDVPLNVFEYPSPEAAAADAAQISPTGQHRLVRITWISTPRFYGRGRLIAVYVGCASDIVSALDTAMGVAFAVGDTPCTGGA